MLIGAAGFTLLDRFKAISVPAEAQVGAAAHWLRCSPSMAHALGAIDAVIYTNSREAFEQSYARGFRFLETDVRRSREGALVLAHDWITPERQHVPRNGPTLDQFRSTRIYERYTPLTLTDLLGLLQRYPDARVTLDLKERGAEARAQMLRDVAENVRSVAPALLDRVIPQVWSAQDAIAALKLYHWPLIYSLHETNDADNAVVATVERFRIAAVVLNRFRLSPEFARRLQGAGAVVYLSVANIAGEAKVYREWGANGIVTDALPPDSSCP